MGLDDDVFSGESKLSPEEQRRIAWRRFAGYVASGLIIAVTFGAGRVGQAFEPIPGWSIYSAFLNAVGFYAVAEFMREYTGGFMSWTHTVGYTILNMAMSFFASNQHKSMKDGTYGTDFFYRNLQPFDSVLFALGGFLIGHLAGFAGVWSFSGTPAMAFLPPSPGSYPGGDAGFTGFAFAVEAIFGALLSAIMSYNFLIGKKGSRKTVLVGALVVFVHTLVSFNKSGSAFDVLFWVTTNLFTGFVTGTFFAGADIWWWAYAFGPLAGVLAGGILGWFAAFNSPHTEERATATPGDDESVPLKPLESRAGNVAGAARSPEELGEDIF